MPVRPRDGEKLLTKVESGACTRFRCSLTKYTGRAVPPARVRYRVRCAHAQRTVSWTVSAD